jgi:hypothetical protein
MDDGSPGPGSVDVAVGREGDLAVTWYDAPDARMPVSPEEMLHLWITTAPPGGGDFRPPRRLAVPAGRTPVPAAPSVAVGPTGWTLTGWSPMRTPTSGPGDAGQVTVDLAPRNDGGAPYVLADDGLNPTPVVGFDALATPVVAWSANTGAIAAPVRASVLAPWGFCAPQTVAPGAFSGRFSFALHPTGGGVLAWSDSYGGRILAATYFASPGCGLPVTAVRPAPTARATRQGRAAVVRVTCAGPARCSGRLRIGGSARFSLRAGGTQALTVTLTAQQRRTLRARGRLRLRVTIRQTGVEAPVRRWVVVTLARSQRS